MSAGESDFDPRELTFDRHGGNRSELRKNIFDIGSERYPPAFGDGSDIFFPLPPGAQCEEEAAGSHGFVCHVTARLTDKAIGPGEDVIEEELVRPNNVIIAENAEGSLGIVLFADLDIMCFGKGSKHGFKIFVNSGVSCDVDFTFFDGTGSMN